MFINCSLDKIFGIKNIYMFINCALDKIFGKKTFTCLINCSLHKIFGKKTCTCLINCSSPILLDILNNNFWNFLNGFSIAYMTTTMIIPTGIQFFSFLQLCVDHHCNKLCLFYVSFTIACYL